MNRTAVFTLAIGLILFATLEGASYLIGAFVFPSSVIFRPSYSAAEQAELQSRYAAYLDTRNPHTGLPLDQQRGRDQSGSRLNPLFPYSQGAENCVSIYGDSFTWSDEVKGIFAWSTVLSELLGCRVGNFGVGGFGTDQAYIRFLNNISDRAPIVFLNHQPENIIRNVTQFRALTSGYESDMIPLNFKPRYILGENESLQLIDLPTFTSEVYPQVLLDPGKYLPYEYFLPGGKTGQVRLAFPYSWTLIRSLRHFHIQAWLANKPWYMDFYKPDHPANGLNITAAIILAFNESANERGQIPVITIIPNGLDLMHYKEHGVWSFQPLLDHLSQSGIDVLNFGVGIFARLDGADPCSLFDNCSSHYNEQGYRLLAEIAFEELTKRGLVPDSTAPADSTTAAN